MVVSHASDHGVRGEPFASSRSQLFSRTRQGCSRPQAILVSLAGYFFDLTRRVSGSNALNSVLHGLFDFALISGSMILLDQQSYLGVFAPILVCPVLAIVLLVKRRDIESHNADESPVTPTA
ncbi:hypothetical protein [Rhodococcus sp. Q]|uniref:hypothetical protein n=1 Tax=Rhodococcus sp. Q TaxID=2502252 RepID=UPI0032D577F1